MSAPDAGDAVADRLITTAASALRTARVNLLAARPVLAPRGRSRRSSVLVITHLSSLS